MPAKTQLRVAIAQASMPLLDLDKGVEVAIDWIRRADREGVELLAFGESFLGGYPLWVDWPGWSDFQSPDCARLFARLRAESLEVDPESERMEALAAACREACMAVVIGADERSPTGKSVYNSLLTFDSEGQLRQVRRKLVPTHGERLCWAPAPDREAAALETMDLLGTRVGGLMCWEHWMPRARWELHRGGEAVHVAAWPHGSGLHQLASRHYAFEGACFVLCTAPILRREDLPNLGIEVPEGFEGLRGGSSIIAPNAHYVVEPVHDREDLLVADLDLTLVDQAAFRLDTAGHYDRPDLFDPR